MTQLIKAFQNNVVGRSNRLTDILPMIDASGNMKTVNDLDVILNSWKNILLTQIGSYDHDPQYGSNLYKLIWEPADDITIDKIKEEVYDKLMIFDDRAQIKNVNVTFFKEGKKGFSVDIDVLYNNETKNLSITVTEDQGML